MPKKYFLGLDQGTTGTSALLLDEEWDIACIGLDNQGETCMVWDRAF